MSKIEPRLKPGDYISSPWTSTMVQSIFKDLDEVIWVKTTTGTKIELKYFLSLFTCDGPLRPDSSDPANYWIPARRQVGPVELDRYKSVDIPA